MTVSPSRNCLKTIESVCPLCLISGTKEVLEVEELFVPTHECFQYIFCANCGSLSLLRVPENLSEYYEDYYAYFVERKKNGVINKLIKRCVLRGNGVLSSFLGRFLTYDDDLKIRSFFPLSVHSDASILDVGCGKGNFVEEMNELGFRNVMGIDPFLIESAFSTSINVHKMSLDEVEGSFDVITFHHSLEHMDNIGGVLTRVSELLRPGGTCIIRVPNIDSIGFKLFRENWFSIHPPYHIRLPSIRCMKALAKKSGLSVYRLIGEERVEFMVHNLMLSRKECIFKSFISGKFFEKRIKKNINPCFSKNELHFCKRLMKASSVSPENSNWIVYYLRKQVGD